MRFQFSTSNQVHPFPMRSILLSLAILFTLLPAVAQAPGAQQTFDALVVVNISGFDDARHEALVREVARNRQATLEYTCVWSGIAVLKFSEVAVSERADIIQLARRILNGAGIERGVEYIHVHAEPRGGGKC